MAKKKATGKTTKKKIPIPAEKKKAAAKRAPAATRSADNNQPPLDPEWDPNALPEDLADKVDVYLQLMRKQNTMAEKVKAAKEAAIESMQEHGLKKIRIDEGKKWLMVTDTLGLKTVKVNLEKDDQRQSVTP